MSHLFCFGLGYSALNLADRLLEAGWRVSGTVRSEAKRQSLQDRGITAYIFDQDLPLDIAWDFDSVTHILHSIPPSQDEAGIVDPVYKYHYHDIENIKDLKWFGYLSTTGVYGNHEGAVVTENSALKATKIRSLLRIQAEKLWLDSKLPVHIFRLSGIYGPRRNAILDLKQGRAHRIHKEGQVFSRIHVSDIANILQASIAKPNPYHIYNGADDLPAPQPEVVEYAAKLLGITPPELINLEDAELSEMARDFWQDNRRVSNQLVKEELGVKFQYPTYKEGLEALLK